MAVRKEQIEQSDLPEELRLGEEIAPNVYLLNEEESRQLLDYHTRRDLGMSAEEFMERLKTFDFPDEDFLKAEALAFIASQLPN